MLVTDTLYYPVRISNVERSGSSILSTDITFSYTNTQLNYLGFAQDASLTDGWSFAENQISSSQVKLVGGGVNPIETNGDIGYLMFKADTTVDSDLNSYPSLNEVFLNEGSPNLKKITEEFLYPPSH